MNRILNAGALCKRGKSRQEKAPHGPNTYSFIVHGNRGTEGAAGKFPAGWTYRSGGWYYIYCGTNRMRRNL